MSDRNSENLGGNRGYSAISGSEVGREVSGAGNTSGGHVEWGPAIAVDGKRPGWLAEDAKYEWRNPDDPRWWAGIRPSRYEAVGSWPFIEAIRLPADHPHYRQTEAAGETYIDCVRNMKKPARPMDLMAAIPEGMKAWHGGSEPPADWDSEKPIAVIDDGKVSIRYGDRWDWSREPVNVYGRKLLRVVAYTPAAAPIDWSGELEAVHEDGRVCAATLADSSCSSYRQVCIDGEMADGVQQEYSFYEDGRRVYARNWRIRNVPQPTPQADTKPDLTARMIGAIRELAARDNGDGTVNLFEIRRTVSDAVEIVALLPEPVDPDLIEAREIMQAKFYCNDPEWQGDLDTTRAYKLIKRGRALALAGEKEA